MDSHSSSYGDLQNSSYFSYRTDNETVEFGDIAEDIGSPRESTFEATSGDENETGFQHLSENNVESDMEVSFESSNETIMENDFEIGSSTESENELYFENIDRTSNESVHHSEIQDNDSEYGYHSDHSSNLNENEVLDNMSDFLPIHESLNCSRADAMKMIEIYRIRHNLTWRAVEDLCNLINKLLGSNSLPISKHLWKKKVMLSNNLRPTFHFCCKQCSYYLGSEEALKISQQKYCANCKTDIDLKKKYRNNFFVILPIAPQIQKIMRNEAFSNLQSTSGNICDIFDAEKYCSLKQQFGNKKFITLTTNTDGARVFKSTKHGSFWPVLHYINEINLNHRFNRCNILCSAFYFGKTPDMNSFLRPFIEEINNINLNEITIPINGISTKISVIPLFLTLDSVAKCSVLNKVQFNGYYGCPTCEHPGTLIGRNIRYCRRDDGPNRTSEGIKNNMIQAHQEGINIKGFKGLSALLGIRIIEFDLVWQIPIDKMHNVDLGVTKKLIDLWINSKNHTKE